MNQPMNRQQSRREMFRGTLRYLAVGGISLLSAGLIARGSKSSGEARCRRPLSCHECAALAGCKLPQAKAAKKRSER